MFKPPNGNGDSVRLTFPVGAPDADLNAMILADGAATLDLEPGQAQSLRMALAGESAAAMSRHSGSVPCELSVELGFEPDERRLTVTAAERTSTTTSCEELGPEWSDSIAVEPTKQIKVEFAGSAFVTRVLPHVFARVALGANAGFGAVTSSALLGDRLAAAAVASRHDGELEVRVHGSSEALGVAIRSSSERVLSAMAAAWPAASERRGAGFDATLQLRTELPAL